MMTNRRSFIKNISLLGMTAAVSPMLAGGVISENKPEIQNQKKKNEMRILGRGKQALRVKPVGLGCLGMSASRSIRPDKREMIKVIRKSYDLGYNLFDTAELYGPFTNEELLGEALKPFRKKVALTTKFGFKNAQVAEGYDSRPETIFRVIDQSLSRLQTDYVDMFYQHRVDPDVPIEEVAGVMGDLIKQGKILRWGMSEADEDSIRRAHAVTPLTAIQNEYSPMVRDSENRFALCEELGIGFVAYSPLCRGLLSGLINERTVLDPNNDTRHRLPHFQAENIIKNWKIIDLFKDFGDARGLTVAQVSLAWILAQKPYIVPIPGTSKSAHAFENFTAAEYQFTADELKTLTEKLMSIDLIVRKG